jgi:hypothetical protein
MPERRPKDPAPDLFAAVASKAPSPRKQNVAPQAMDKPTGSSVPRRYILPSDLAGALTRLNDAEIDALLLAATDEAKRRGRLSQSRTELPAGRFAEANRQIERVPRAPTRAKPVPSRSDQAVVGDAAPSLALGKANAVRAAFMAGVKPSAIARKFGISQAAVKQALAANKAGRKS